MPPPSGFTCPTCGPDAESEPFTLPTVAGGVVSGRQCKTCDYKAVTVRAKGFACPTCHGRRLHVYKTRVPSPGLIVRYRTCLACGHRAVTREVAVRVSGVATRIAPWMHRESEPETAATVSGP